MNDYSTRNLNSSLILAHRRAAASADGLWPAYEEQTRRRWWRWFWLECVLAPVVLVSVVGLAAGALYLWFE